MGFLAVGVAAVERLRVGLSGRVDEAGAAQALVAFLLAQALLNEDAVGGTGPLADAFLKLEG